MYLPGGEGLLLTLYFKEIQRVRLFFLSKVNRASQLGVILSQQTNLVTLLAVMISMGMLRVPRKLFSCGSSVSSLNLALSRVINQLVG